MKAPLFIENECWPWAVSAHRAGERAPKPARVRRRPDVAGYFTFTLVAALASGTLVLGDLIRARLPVDEALAFAAQHPLTLILGCCVAILAGLLAVGDV